MTMAPAGGQTPFGAEFGKRVVSAVVLAPLGVGLAYLGGPLAIAAAALVAALLLWEWNDVTRAGARDGPFFAALGALALVALALLAGWRLTALVAVLLVLGLVAARFAADGPRTWLGRGLLYALCFLVPIALIRESARFGLEAVFFLFAVVWATDICAFFAGRILGGPKLWPALSPKKTWAGFVGGTLGGVLSGLGMLALFGAPAGPPLAALAFGLSLCSHAGDLFESWVKRRFHHKDSGALIPGHGGAMDRLDGFIFVVAAALLLGLARGGPADVAGGLLAW